MKLPSKKALIIGGSILGITVVLVVSGAWKPLGVFLLGLMGIGGAVKRGGEQKDARESIEAARAKYEAEVAEIREDLEARAAEDQKAIERREAPDKEVVSEADVADERERMEANVWGEG